MLLSYHSIVFSTTKMGLSEDIKQDKFTSEYSKAIINILYTNSWLQQQYIQQLKTHDLTIPQFNILRILRGQHPSPAKVNLLIERMLDKSSNASRIVDKLEQKELVKRNQCSNDKRAVDVCISDKGLLVLEEMDAKMEEWEHANNTLTEQEAVTLNTLLDKLRKSV